MISPDIDTAAIIAAVAKDGVYLPDSAPKEQRDELIAISQSASTSSGSASPSVGIVILDQNPGDARDLAQTVLNNTSTQTVIVKSPAANQAVSTIYSRANIEHSIPTLYTEQPVAASQNFLSAVDRAPTPPWGLTTVILIAIILITWAVTYTVSSYMSRVR